MISRNDTLKRRMATLATTNRQLRRDIVRHTSARAILKKRSEHYAALWKASRVLQQDLRRLTQQMLQAQEEQRKHISHELQDVIAQTRLGIHVKLHALRRGTQDARRNITGGIATTQKLVKVTERSVRKATKKLDKR
jgi:signal transduction histidine kinase